MKSEHIHFRSRKISYAISIMLFMFMSCIQKPNNEIEKKLWGKVDNKEVYLYTLTNAKGMQVKITNYGGIITSILVPDKLGKLEDVVLGFDNLEQYLQPHPYFGAVIGRFANRIKGGKFSIDNKTYNLAQNRGKNTLHGGDEFDRVVWNSSVEKRKDESSVKLNYISKDRTNGFPGNLSVNVVYTLTDNNTLDISFTATTDKTTHVNLTQHSYFNLSALKSNVREHIINIDADTYIEVDEDNIPTGIISTVNNKALDLRESTKIGKNIDKLDFNGYDNCYVLNKPTNKLSEVVKVVEPISQRRLTVLTTQPGVQFYTGNFLKGNLQGKHKRKYAKHDGFCLETQHFPDTPNHSNFPSTLLNPGEKYEERVIYKFDIAK